MEILRLLRALFRSTAGKIVGIGVTLSVVVSILKLTPDQWTKNLGAWIDLVRGIDSNILWLVGVALLLIGFYEIYRQNTQQIAAQFEVTDSPVETEGPQAADVIYYDKHELQTELRRLIEIEGVDDIRVFAYTAETLRDYLIYADRYRPLSIRILIRDWTEERIEEEAYNQELVRRDAYVRPWIKWRKIKGLAQEFSDQMKSGLPYKVQVRFFRGAPLLKGVIVCNQRTGCIDGFLGLYKWVEWPEEGGSRYKGEGGVVLHLCSDHQRHRLLLERFVSHFDRIWLQESLTFEEIEKSQSVEVPTEDK